MRSKWNKDDVRQLNVNHLVCAVDESVKRSNYKMAKVLKVQKGSDGRVRSATVVTKDGKLKKTVVKLPPLLYEKVFRETNRVAKSLNREQQLLEQKLLKKRRELIHVQRTDT